MPATLDKFGRIVIPKRVRDDLGLEPGSVLKVEERGTDILLTPVSENSEAALEWNGGVLVFTGEALEDLTNVVERDQEERLVHLTGLPEAWNQPPVCHQGVNRSSSGSARRRIG
jgi:AbrB family looped-hinge helix DNA binding protein